MGLAVAAIAAGIGLPGVARADSVGMSFEGSVTEVPRGAQYPGEALVVSIDDATAAAHPDAVMTIGPKHPGDGPPAIAMSGILPVGCQSFGDTLECAVSPRGGGPVTRWTSGLISLGDVAAEGTTYTATLVEGDAVVASADHAIAVGENELELTTWTETMTAAPGQTASFAPYFANRPLFPLWAAGVVIHIEGADKVRPVADYDNCDVSARGLICVVPEFALRPGDTIAVSPETPLGLRLDEQGPYDDVCSTCFQYARAVGVAEARRQLEQFGGTETGNVLRLVAADPPDREPDPWPVRDPNLILQVGS